jgi:microsomal dipeptidase-like Zn-dependent dipeptidase
MKLARAAFGRTWAIAAFWLLAAVAPRARGEGATGYVDLHAHLFFSEGIGIGLWNHGFDTEVLSPRWDSYYSARVNAEALAASGAAIVVVALYAHPLIPGGERAAIRRQLDALDRFLASRPGWAIARSSTEARAQLASGKRVLVLQIEGAGGILETEPDFEEFIDRRGVRIVTIHHFTDDRNGGAAFMRGIRALANPLAWIKHGFARLNPQGLTDHGRSLARSLRGRGVWLDLSHASDASQADTIELLRRADGVIPPLLYTHTVLREFYDCERGITAAQLDRVKATGGVVGLLPSTEMLAGTPPTAEGCDSGAEATLTQARRMLERVAPSQLDFGSDINAPIPFLAASSATAACPAETSVEWTQYGELGRLWKLLEARTAVRAAASLEHFLQAWDRQTGS